MSRHLSTIQYKPGCFPQKCSILSVSNAEVTIMEGIVSNEHDVAGSPFTRVTMEPEPLVDEFFYGGERFG